MVKSRFGQMILLGIQRFQDPYYQGFAAQMAFFYLLSIVPLIIVFSQLLDVFSISTELIEELLKQYAGGVIGDSVSGWLEGSGSVTTNIVLIATVLWSFIENVISENIGKDITIVRDEDNDKNYKLYAYCGTFHRQGIFSGEVQIYSYYSDYNFFPCICAYRYSIR